MSRRKYDINILVNNKLYTQLIIDPHYEEKHGNTVNDDVVIAVAKKLYGEVHIPKDIDEDGFQYFVNELYYRNKKFKLIWLTHPNESYLGVVNIYRR